VCLVVVLLLSVMATVWVLFDGENCSCLCCSRYSASRSTAATVRRDDDDTVSFFSDESHQELELKSFGEFGEEGDSTRNRSSLPCWRGCRRSCQSVWLNCELMGNIYNLVICAAYMYARIDSASLYLNPAVADVTWVAVAGVMNVSSAYYLRSFQGSKPHPSAFPLTASYLNFAAGAVFFGTSVLYLYADYQGVVTFTTYTELFAMVLYFFAAGIDASLWYRSYIAGDEGPGGRLPLSLSLWSNVFNVGPAMLYIAGYVLLIVQDFEASVPQDNGRSLARWHAQSLLSPPPFVTTATQLDYNVFAWADSLYCAGAALFLWENLVRMGCFTVCCSRPRSCDLPLEEVVGPERGGYELCKVYRDCLGCRCYRREKRKRGLTRTPQPLHRSRSKMLPNDPDLGRSLLRADSSASLN
jgi:hypothetical protein